MRRRLIRLYRRLLRAALRGGFFGATARALAARLRRVAGKPGSCKHKRLPVKRDGRVLWVCIKCGHVLRAR